jgi:3-oxoacyl-[acyl-carrier-protein] synthase-1
MSQRAYLPVLGIVNALGGDADTVAAALFAGDTSGMLLEEHWLPSGPARVGRARGALPALPARFAAYDCRNNRLLLAALAQIEATVDAMLGRYGRARVGSVLGPFSLPDISASAARPTPCRRPAPRAARRSCRRAC